MTRPDILRVATRPRARHGGRGREGRRPMSSLIELSEARERAAAGGHRAYRFYDLLMVAFVTVLICSEFISPRGRSRRLGSFNFGAGVVFFPLSYLFGDVLTEVYGYARSRKVIWAGFAALAFSTFMAWVILSLPPLGIVAEPGGVGDGLRRTRGGSWRRRSWRSSRASGSIRWCSPR